MTVYTNPKPRQTAAWIKRTMFKQSLGNVYLKVVINKSRAVMWYLLLHWKKKKKRWLLKHILQGRVSICTIKFRSTTEHQLMRLSLAKLCHTCEIKLYCSFMQEFRSSCVAKASFLQKFSPLLLCLLSQEKAAFGSKHMLSMVQACFKKHT